jgi:16S rRNA (uracil1498-N3)-methyltransferase
MVDRVMALARFFLVEPMPAEGETLPLTEDDVRHLLGVRRAEAGQRIIVVDPESHAFVVSLESVSSSGVRGSVERELERPFMPDVTLVIALAKGDVVDAAVQGAVEVGVSGVLPVAFSRCVVRLDASKAARRTERWRRIALSAAKQSQRFEVPAVSAPVEFDGALAQLADYDLVLVAWEGESERDARRALCEAVASSSTRVAVVVGPEGGFGADEIESLRAAGAVTFTLGPTILRAGTAGIVAPALAIDALRAMRDEPAK